MAKRPRPLELGNLLSSIEDDKLRRELVTPEGIPLHLKLAQAGERAAAFVLDSLLMFGALFVLGLLLAMAFGEAGSGWVTAFVVVSAFFIVNFYFIFFEIRWQGATPAKRIIGLRVVDRQGGQLSTDAIVTRNFLRWVEVYIPALILMAPETFWPGAPQYATVAASGWLIVIMLLPLFNKDRLRVGDFVGGTLVVENPKAMLLPDLGHSEEPVYVEAATRAKSPDYTFTEKQLSHYGVYELQVLEEVLRKKDDSVNHFTAVHTVYERIARKIGWAAPSGHKVDAFKFLSDFYAAQRADLEQKMLFGQKREDKFSN